MSLTKPEQTEDVGGVLRSLPILRRARLAVMGLGAALLSLAIVFPPWAASYYDGTALVQRDPAGVHWILSPPRRSDLTTRDVLEMAQRGEVELARRITADMADDAGAESWRNTWLVRLGLRMEHDGRLLAPSYAVDFERLSLHLGAIVLGMASAMIALGFFARIQGAPTSLGREVVSSTEGRQGRHAGRAWRRLFGFALLSLPGCWANQSGADIDTLSYIAESAGGICGLGMVGILVGGMAKLLGGTMVRGVVIGMGLGGALALASSWHDRPAFGADAGGWTGYLEGLVLGLVFLLLAWDFIFGDHVNRRGPARAS